jgi:hypothetical protein
VRDIDDCGDGHVADYARCDPPQQLLGGA